MRTLSSGMKRRLEIARAFVHDARILFLDEPTVGLDAQSRERMWQLRAPAAPGARAHRHRHHPLHRGGGGCDRVCIIDRGHILANDTPAALKVAPWPAAAARRAGGRCDRGRDRAAYPDLARSATTPRSCSNRAARPSRRRSCRAIGGRIRRVRRRGAEPRKRVPVAHRPRASRPGRGRARADLCSSADAGASTRDDRAPRRTAPTGARAIAPQLGGLYAIWLREVKRAIRDRGQLIGGVSRPLLWVLIMGIGLNPYFRGEIYGEVRFVVPYTYLQFIFPAVIALNIMYTSVQSAVSTIWDREFGFLREILVSPLPRVHHPAGQDSRRSTVALFHGCLVLVLARFADVTLSPADLLYGAGADVSARVRADLARRRDRQPGAQLRGLRRVLQRGDPAALLHVELDLSARSVAHRRRRPRWSIRNGW